MSYRQPPLRFKVGGREIVDSFATAGPLLSSGWARRGAAMGDLDDDGVSDLVVSNLGGAPFVARNTSDAGHLWVGVELRGCWSNLDGIDSRMSLRLAAGHCRYRTVARTASNLSARGPRSFFGVGPIRDGLKLEVDLPS